MIRNAARLQRKLSSLPDALTQPISNALVASVGEMRGYAIRKIQAHGSAGRTYRRGSRTHTASAAGSFPNTDTGALVANIKAGQSGRFVAWFGALIKYAGFLEFGTHQMAPRPFMRPTYGAHKEKVRERVNTAIKATLRGLR